jgi:hypothetical protein
LGSVSFRVFDCCADDVFGKWADAISRLKFLVLAVVVTSLCVSIWKRKFWLSLVAYTLGGLYWLLMVYSATGVPLD